MIQDSKKAIENNKIQQAQQKELLLRVEALENVLHLTWDPITLGYLEGNAPLSERTKNLSGFEQVAMRDAIDSGDLKKSTTAVTNNTLKYNKSGNVAVRPGKVKFVNKVIASLDQDRGND